MARPKGSKKKGPPSYLKHSATGKPYVNINGKPIYLGARDEYDSASSWSRYYKVIAEHGLRGGQGVGDADKYNISITELIAGFWRDLQRRGLSKSIINCYRVTLRALRELYGQENASDFSPLKKRAITQQLLEHGTTWIDRHHHRCRSKLCRTTINSYMRMLDLTFRWGESVEMVRTGVFNSLRSVSPLQRGEGADDYPHRRPVSRSHVEAVLPFLTKPMRAAIELMSLTGARPAEIAVLRAIDIDTKTSPWVYRPHKHKLEKKGKSRVLYFDVHCQKIIDEFITPNLNAYLFTGLDCHRASQDAHHRGRVDVVFESLVTQFGHESTFTLSDILTGDRDGFSFRNSASRRNGQGGVRWWLDQLYELGAVVRTRKSRQGYHYRVITREQWAPASKRLLTFARRASQKRKPNPAMCLKTDSVRRAVARAIDRANEAAAKEHQAAGRPGDPPVIPYWTPYQTRHAFLTYVCNKYGIEVASRLAGHSSTKTTDIYTRFADEQAIRTVKDIEQAREQGAAEFAVDVAGRIGVA